MGNVIVGCITGILALGILCITGFSCSQQTKASIGACIEKTGEPIECQSAFQHLDE